MDGLQWKILLKLMIWGCPYFRKPSFRALGRVCIQRFWWICIARNTYLGKVFTVQWGVHQHDLVRWFYDILCIRMPSGNWECVWFLTCMVISIMITINHYITIITIITLLYNHKWIQIKHLKIPHMLARQNPKPQCWKKPGLSASKRDKNWE